MMNPFNRGYYNEHELKSAGFRSIGRNVQIDKNCTIIGVENISIGDSVRIDGYCSIVAAGKGSLSIGSFVHIGGHCHLSAGAGINMDDFSGLSQGTKIYSTSDDYTGQYLTNPTVPEKYKRTTRGVVRLGRHAIIGAGSVIFPKVTIGEGAAVGALSLVTKSLDPWGVYLGCPARRLKDRSRRLLELVPGLMQEIVQQGA